VIAKLPGLREVGYELLTRRLKDDTSEVKPLLMKNVGVKVSEL